MPPVGVGLLALVGVPMAVVFAVFRGAGNGILTIAKGTLPLPLLLFGPTGYGHRQRLLMAPARIAQAASPWVFRIFWDRLGPGALWISAGLGVAALAALLAVSTPKGSPQKTENKAR